MRTTILPRGGHHIAILGVSFCLLICTACGKLSGDKVDSAGAHAKAPVVNEAPPNAKDKANSKPIAEPSSRDTEQKDRPVSAGATKPYVGTGGSDFFLFTQARAALAADAELKATNIILDVKGGVLTLSGTVANAAQKSKAEKLMSSVSGVRAVTNRLRISS